MYLKKIKIGNVELDNNLILAPMAGRKAEKVSKF